MVLKSASLSIGLPHSGHSGGVSGRSRSSMVLRTSTNGTSATMPANNSPARLATAPISMPPALPPCPTIRFAAGPPAMSDDPFCGGVFFGDQRARGRGEIIEGIGLLLTLAVEIPTPALV